MLLECIMQIREMSRGIVTKGVRGKHSQSGTRVRHVDSYVLSNAALGISSEQAVLTIRGLG